MMNTLPVRLFLLGVALVMTTGCASFGKKWKELISGDAGTQQQAAQMAKPMGTTYSEQTQMTPSTYRKYNRTTKKDFEDQARVDSRAGSLWVMEGQGAYLFSQNVVRMIGDPVAIRIEGDPQEQLSQKAKVISDLLAQLEERRRRAFARQAAEEKKPGAKKGEAEAGKEGDPAAAGNTAQALPGEGPNNRGPASTDKDAFNVKNVPTRIVERLVDGNYRVRGTQPFMIGSREYKVIVSGVVKSEDFNEEGISATQLLDPNFDIVSSRSAEAMR